MAIAHHRVEASWAERVADAFLRRWYAWFLLISGIWVSLPWLAPVLMHLGWVGPARAVYAFYSLQCHQLPRRSFFLYGPQPMFSLAQINAGWRDTLDPRLLRQFIGTPAMGYKVAWSDRMVSLYTSIPIAAALWLPVRRRLRPLPFWGFLLLAIPMLLDGGSHLLSDLSGIGQGFRYDNLWLARLTAGSLPVSFYAGDALGSFNSWMRLLTGMIFGVALVWAVFPQIDTALAGVVPVAELGLPDGERRA